MALGEPVPDSLHVESSEGVGGLQSGPVGFVFLGAAVGARFVNYPTFSILGPLWCAGALQKQGVEVLFWDALTESVEGRLVEDRGSYRKIGPDPTGEEIVSWARGLDLVVFPVDPFRDPHGSWGAGLASLSRALKAAYPEVLLVISDCYAGGADYLPLDPGGLLGRFPDMDLYLRGESERALVALVSGRDWWDIPGVWGRLGRSLPGRWGRGTEGVGLPGRRGDVLAPAGSWGLGPESLDELGPPAFHLLDMERFFASQREAVGMDLVPEFHDSGRLLPLATSRGCPYRCRFCAGKIKRFEAYSQAGLSELLKTAVAFEPTHLFFMDDVINLDPNHAQAVCRAVRKAGGGAGLRWTVVNGMRADMLSADLMQQMADSGAFGLKISAETADRSVMAWMGKRLDVTAAQRTARAAAGLDIPLMVHYLVGLPPEDMRRVNRTLHEAVRLFEDHGARPRLQYAVPLPGTALAREVSAFDADSPPQSMTELAPFFSDRPITDLPKLGRGALRLAVEAFSSRMRAAADPTLMLDVTLRCNQGCRFCAVSGSGGEDPSPSDLYRAIQWARYRGIRRVDLSGGEPTLSEGLVDLVEQSVDSGLVDVGLVTNGRRLAYRPYVERLVSVGVRRFMVSVVGSRRDLVADITRVPESLDQTLAGLENLAALGAPHSLNITVCRSNLQYLPETLAFYRDRFPLDSIAVQFVVPMGRASAPGVSFRSAQDWRAIVRTVQDVLQQMPSGAASAGGPPSVTFLNVPPCLLADAAESALDPGRFGQVQWLEGRPVWFHRVLGRVLAKPDVCRSCPLSILCKGLPARLAAEQDDLVQPGVWEGREESLADWLADRDDEEHTVGSAGRSL